MSIDSAKRHPLWCHFHDWMLARFKVDLNLKPSSFSPTMWEAFVHGAAIQKVAQ